MMVSAAPAPTAPQRTRRPPGGAGSRPWVPEWVIGPWPCVRHAGAECGPTECGGRGARALDSHAVLGVEA